MVIRNKAWFEREYKEINNNKSEIESFILQLIVAYIDKEIEYQTFIEHIKRIFSDFNSTLSKPLLSILNQLITYSNRQKINQHTINNLLQNLLNLISFPSEQS
jgi:hypothetical protein